MKGLLAAAFPLLALCSTALAQSGSGPSAGPDANPGRPTVSTPATTTPAGYIQFETGALAAARSPEFSSRYSFGEVVKFSISPRIEVLASDEPIVHFTTCGNPRNRPAELFLGEHRTGRPNKRSPV